MTDELRVSVNSMFPSSLTESIWMTLYAFINAVRGALNICIATFSFGFVTAGW